MAKNFRDLVIWQLARELRLQVLRMTGHRSAPIDREFVRDIRRSARSVASNIAEGHARFRPKDNHHFLEIAKASLAETETHLDDGLESRYFTKAEHSAAMLLVRRITPGMSSLMEYLRSPQAEANYQRLLKQSRSRSAQKSANRNL